MLFECFDGLLLRHAGGCDPFGDLFGVTGVCLACRHVGDEVRHGSQQVGIASPSACETEKAAGALLEGRCGAVLGMEVLRWVAPCGEGRLAIASRQPPLAEKGVGTPMVRKNPPLFPFRVLYSGRPD